MCENLGPRRLTLILRVRVLFFPHLGLVVHPRMELQSEPTVCMPWTASQHKAGARGAREILWQMPEQGAVWWEAKRRVERQEPKGAGGGVPAGNKAGTEAKHYIL
jgi:hypothetical protein